MITKPLLASPADLDAIRYPVLATPKLDGIRAVNIGGKVLSRSFKPIPNKFIQRELPKILPLGIFDGELMIRGTNNFQDVTSGIMSIEGEPDFTYCIFDYIYDGLDTPYHERMKRLVDLFTDNPLVKSGRLSVLAPVAVRTRDDLDRYEAQCLERGYEGVMIRDPHGKYKCGRSTTKEGILLKVKRFEDSEAVILECFEKMKNTNEQEKNEVGHSKRSTSKAGMVPTGTLGGFSVRDVKTGVEFSIGSGLNDKLRADIWKDRNSYIGKTLKYKFQPVGVKEAPRFPIFLGIRHENDM